MASKKIKYCDLNLCGYIEGMDTNLSTAYQKFFNKMKEFNSTPVDKWDTTYLLGYFCNKYKEHYGVDYTFSFSSAAPSKSEEVWRLKSVGQNLSSNPKILKDYIDWIFAEKVQLRKKRITSLGYLANRDLINDFKFKYLANKTSPVIDRTTKLPEKYLSIVFQHNPDIETYGQLAFIKQMGSQEKMFNELTQIGFDITMLDKIK